MEPLIDTVLALEQEADRLIEQAHGLAKQIKSAAEEELRTYRDQLAHERQQRLQDMEQAAKDRFERVAAEEEGRAKDALKAIATIPQDMIESQIERILSRFREG